MCQRHHFFCVKSVDLREPIAVKIQDRKIKAVNHHVAELHLFRCFKNKQLELEMKVSENGNSGNTPMGSPVAEELHRGGGNGENKVSNAH